MPVYFAPGYDSNPFGELEKLVQAYSQMRDRQSQMQMQELDIARATAPGQQVAGTLQQLQQGAMANRVHGAASQVKQGAAQQLPGQSAAVPRFGLDAQPWDAADGAAPLPAEMGLTGQQGVVRGPKTDMQRAAGAPSVPTVQGPAAPGKRGEPVRGAKNEEEAQLYQQLQNDPMLGPMLRQHMGVLDDPQASLHEKRQAHLALGTLNDQLFHPEFGAVPGFQARRARAASDESFQRWLRTQSPEVQQAGEIARMGTLAGLQPQVVSELMQRNPNAWQQVQIERTRQEIAHYTRIEDADRAATATIAEVIPELRPLIEALPGGIMEGASQFFMREIAGERQSKRQLQNSLTVEGVRAQNNLSLEGVRARNNQILQRMRDSGDLDRVILQGALNMRDGAGNPLPPGQVGTRVRGLLGELPGLMSEAERMTYAVDLTRAADFIQPYEQGLSEARLRGDQFDQFMSEINARMESESEVTRRAVTSYFEGTYRPLLGEDGQGPRFGGGRAAPPAQRAGARGSSSRPAPATTSPPNPFANSGPL